MPLGALARQRCRPCQVFVIKVDPMYQRVESKPWKSASKWDSEALCSSVCQGLGVGTCSRLSAQHPGASPQHHSLCQGISVVITSKWLWGGEGLPSSHPRNALTQGGREVFRKTLLFQRGPSGNMRHPVKPSLSIIYNNIHVRKTEEAAVIRGSVRPRF